MMDAMSQPSSAGAGQVTASWQQLARLPQMLGEVKTGLLALRVLVSTPPAAVGSGSPVAGAAIVGLGAEVLVFLAQTVQAIDDDIDAMTQVSHAYQRNETDLAGAAAAGTQSLGSLTGARHPSLNGGIQSCTARGAMYATSVLDDVAVPVSTAVRAVGDASQVVLHGAAGATRSAGRAVGAMADSMPFIPGVGINPRTSTGGSMWGDVVRTGSAAQSTVLRGASDAVEAVERTAASGAAAAQRLSRRADDLLTLDGSCSTGTTPPAPRPSNRLTTGGTP
jgi:hypothetical protein